MHATRVLACLAATVALFTACGGGSSTSGGSPPPAASRYATTGASPVNVYIATGPGALSPAAAAAKPLVYVPNTLSDSVTVIDPATHTVVRTFATGKLPQHLVPSYDISRLRVSKALDDRL